jgi:hypothetical protein
MAGERFDGEIAGVDGEYANETLIAAKLAEESHDFLKEFVEEIVANVSGARGTYDLWRTRYLTITDRDDVNALVAPYIMDQNWDVSRWAITVLAMRGGADAEAALLDAVENAPSYWAKRTAVWGLGLINAGRGDKADARVFAALKSNKALHDPDFQTVAAAVSALGMIGGKDALDTVLGSLAGEEDVFVLSAMIDALMQMGDPKGIAAVEALKTHNAALISAKATGVLNGDAAMKGGIDIQNIALGRTGDASRIQFDTAALQKFVDEGFTGLTPVFLEMRPMATPLMAMSAQY